VQFDDTGAGPVRYRLLETVRQYAARQLDGQHPAAEGARRAHRDTYLALAEAAAPELVAHGQVTWLDRLDLELDNIRTAIAYTLKQADPAPGIRLAAALRVFWKARGHAAEGTEALRALLSLPAAQEATLLRARALVTAAYLLEQMGSYPTAERYCDEALPIAQAAGDGYLVADLMDVRGYVLLRRGQPAAAIPLIELGLGLARQLGEAHLTARLLAARAFALDLQGDRVGAARDAAESLLLYREVGDRRQVGTMVGNLGYVELSIGEIDTARRHLLESLEIARELSDHYGVVYETFNLGLADYLGGSADAAAELFAESLRLATRMQMKQSIAYALIGLAMTGGGGAGLSRSARLHGAADQALSVLGETIEPLEGGLRDRDFGRLRSAMGAEAFEAEYAAGQALTSEQALAVALGDPSLSPFPGPGGPTRPPSFRTGRAQAVARPPAWAAGAPESTVASSPAHRNGARAGELRGGDPAVIHSVRPGRRRRVLYEIDGAPPAATCPASAVAQRPTGVCRSSPAPAERIRRCHGRPSWLAPRSPPGSPWRPADPAGAQRRPPGVRWHRPGPAGAPRHPPVWAAAPPRPCRRRPACCSTGCGTPARHTRRGRPWSRR